MIKDEEIEYLITVLQYKINTIKDKGNDHLFISEENRKEYIEYDKEMIDKLKIFQLERKLDKPRWKFW